MLFFLLYRSADEVELEYVAFSARFDRRGHQDAASLESFGIIDGYLEDI